MRAAGDAVTDGQDI